MSSQSKIWLVLAGTLGVTGGVLYSLHNARVAEAAAAEQEQAVPRPVVVETAPAAQPPPAPVTRPAPQRVEAPIANPSSPAEIIQRLMQIRVGTGPVRIRRLREVVFQLESLGRLGDSAVMEIRSFLLRKEDMPYLTEAMSSEGVVENATADAAEEGETPEDRAGRDRAAADRRARDLTAQVVKSRMGEATVRRVKLTFEFPPTLRLGLFDALRSIGTPQAESILAEALKTSTRGVEVAYIARLLEDWVPGRYKDASIETARELLRSPPQVDATVQIDARQKDYLYSVFDLYGDKSFSTEAQQALVGADGQLDRHAFEFVKKSLREGALPQIYQAWTDPRVTNHSDRAALLTSSLPYTGGNPYADAIFANVITNTGLPMPLRSAALNELVGNWPGRGTRGDSDHMDAGRARTRLQLLQAVAPGLTEDSMIRAAERAARRLNERANGTPDQ